MTQRRRFKQKQTLEDRLASYAASARKVAAGLPPGAEKDELLRKANQADTAAHLNGAWAQIKSSDSGLDPGPAGMDLTK